MPFRNDYLYRDKLRSEEDFKKTIAFLEREKKMDEENFKEMLMIEPSHLTKAKITAMGKLGDQWKKQSNSLIKKYKEDNQVKEKHKKYSLMGLERTWFTT